MAPPATQVLKANPKRKEVQIYNASGNLCSLTDSPDDVGIAGYPLAASASTPNPISFEHFAAQGPLWANGDGSVTLKVIEVISQEHEGNSSITEQETEVKV